jgi:phage shock protein C
MKKRLYRSRTQKFVGGVLGGLAEYYNSDPTIWRLGFIILLALTGVMPFILVYCIAWVIVPLEPEIAAMKKEEYAAEDEPHGT